MSGPIRNRIRDDLDNIADILPLAIPASPAAFRHLQQLSGISFRHLLPASPAADRTCSTPIESAYGSDTAAIRSLHQELVQLKPSSSFNDDVKPRTCTGRALVPAGRAGPKKISNILTFSFDY